MAILKKKYYNYDGNLYIIIQSILEKQIQAVNMENFGIKI